MSENVTKERLQYIVNNWDNMTSKEISENLGVKHLSVTSWIYSLRKQGINLKRKGGQNGILRTFVNDYLEKHPERRKLKDLDKVRNLGKYHGKIPS